MKRLACRVAIFALLVWAIGLAVAAARLAAWNGELVHTLLQIRADAAFRINMAQRGEPISREWYHTKALALLQASDKLQDDTLWAIFVPGAWRRFDDLRERVAARIEREFSEIAVETVRRELYFRTSQLTGVPQEEATGELAAAECKEPVRAAGAPFAAEAPSVDAIEETPEYAAVREHVSAIARLDTAVQAMLALQDSQDAATAGPDRLRLLVSYTLGVRLPGRLTRTAALFSNGLRPWDAAQEALGMLRLQQAVRCSLGKAMRALDRRVYERDPLLSGEVQLQQREARLLGAGGRQLSPADAEREMRGVIARIDAQEALLARGGYDWLYRREPSLGPAHDSLLARVSHIRLLGADAVLQLRRQSAVAMARYRTAFDAAFRRGSEAALQWHGESAHLTPSRDRLALRDALVALMQEPFMSTAGDASDRQAGRSQLARKAAARLQALAPGSSGLLARAPATAEGEGPPVVR